VELVSDRHQEVPGNRPLRAGPRSPPGGRQGAGKRAAVTYRHPGYVLTDWALFTSSLTVEEKLVLGATLAVRDRNPSQRQLERWLPITKLAIQRAQQQLDAREGFLYRRPEKRLIQPEGFRNPIRDGSNKLIRVPPKCEPFRRDSQPEQFIQIPGRLVERLPRARGKSNAKNTVLIVLAWAREEVLAGGVLVSDEAIGARLGLSRDQVEHARDELRALGVVTRKNKAGYFKVTTLFPGSEHRKPDRLKEPLELQVLQLRPPLRYIGTERQREAVIDYGSRMPEESVYEAAEAVRRDEGQTDPNRAVNATGLVRELRDRDTALRQALKGAIPTLDPTLTPTLDPDSLPQTSLTVSSTSCAENGAEDVKTTEQAPKDDEPVLHGLMGLVRASSGPGSEKTGLNGGSGGAPLWVRAPGKSAPWRSWKHAETANEVGYCADDETHARIAAIHDKVQTKYGDEEAFGTMRAAIFANGKPENDGRIVLRRLIRRWDEPFPEYDAQAVLANLGF
jgi:hypothetical protein